MISSTKTDIVSDLAHVYVEGYGTSYVDAVEKAEKLLSDRVGARKSENSDSKEINDSITEN